MSSNKSAKNGIAFLGFGRVGRIHFKCLVRNSRAKILYLIDEVLEPLKEVCNEWSLNDTVVLKPQDLDKALKDDRVVGIVICSPTSTHVNIIESACAAGKHVFCEKPISYTVEETAKCYTAAERNNVQLFCGFNRRFDPAIRKVYTKVRAGQIGTPQLLVHNNRDHPEPKETFLAASSGGMFLDVGIHSLDISSWIAGEQPTEISAMAHASKDMYVKQGDVDVFGVMLKYPSGLVAYTNSCRYAPYGYDQRLEVLGNKGCLVAENERDDQVVERTEKGDLITPIQNSFPERYLKSYELEMEHFLDILEGKTKCEVSGSDVILATKVCMAAHESWKSNKTITLN